MTEVTVKRDFAEKYVQLIELGDLAPSSTFYSTFEYSNLTNLGPTLPSFKLPFPKSKNSSEQAVSKVSFKSIKPPYKFTGDLSNIASSETIYKLKSQLISKIDTLKGLAPDNLKLLLKSKVVQDSATLSSLGDNLSEISFNVMVSPPKVEKKETPVNDDDDPEDIEPISISSATWDKILTALNQDLGSAKALEVLQKFKSLY